MLSEKSESGDFAKSAARSFSIQLICPIYNEGENVRVLYQQLLADQISFDSLKFVYDFDEDITLPIIEELHSQDSRVYAEKNEFGRGVVNALRWGFSKAENGPVIVVMGDNSDKLSVIPEAISLWKSGAIIVSPSRYMKGGAQYGGGIIKSGLSRIAGLSLNVLGFPTSDPTNNFKLYDGKWLKNQQIESTGGFEVAIELCFKAYSQGKQITQLPTEWHDRTLGESRFQFRKWLPLYMKWYFATLAAILKKPFLA